MTQYTVAAAQSSTGVRAKALSLLLAFALVFSFMPFATQQAYAAGEDKTLEVSSADCTAVGDWYDGTLYYLESDAAIEKIHFSEYDGNCGMLSNFVGDYFIFTNTVSISDSVVCSYDDLAASDDAVIDSATLDGLNLDNAYFFWLMDADYNSTGFIINAPNASEPAPEASPADITVTAQANGEDLAIVSTTEGGYTYENWMGSRTSVDLQTIAIPRGTTEVTLNYSKSCLTYNYKLNTTLGYQIDDDYLSGAVVDFTKGATSCTVKVDSNNDGLLDAVQIQNPYNADYSGGELIAAVTFIYEDEIPAAFTAYAQGIELTNVSYAGMYSFTDWDSTEVSVPMYKVVLPDNTDEVNLVYDKNCLTYNYDDNYQYLAGYTENFTVGSSSINVKVDANGDGKFDYIRVQNPYNADYSGGELLYVVSFTGKEKPVVSDPANASAQDLYDSTKTVLNTWLDTDSNNKFGSSASWVEIGLTRSGDAAAEAYYSTIEQKLADTNGVLSTSSYTEYSRTILQLVAMGYDPSDVASHNLLMPLADYNAVAKQGVNGLIYALLALDSYNFEIPENENAEVQTTRPALISGILANQQEAGWWAYNPKFGPDVDMTCMAIQALAPYYQVDKDVTVAIDAALTYLSDAQNANGGLSTPESDAQAIIALCALGINPDTDSRFVKGEKSLVDDLCTYGSEQGFARKVGGTVNNMTTQQAFLALTSYFRLLDGKNSLYDMNDIEALYVAKDGHQYANEELLTSVSLTELGQIGQACRLCGHVDEESLQTVGEMVSFESILSEDSSSDVAVEGEIVSAPNDGINPRLIINKCANEEVTELLSSDACKLSADNVIGSYTVTLMNGDEEVVEGFGQLTLSFTVDSSLNGETIEVHHLHNGTCTTTSHTVVDGKVSLTVSELSPFILVKAEAPAPNPGPAPVNPDAGGDKSDEDTKKADAMPDTGDNTAKALGAAAVLALAALAGAAVSIRNRKEY